MSVQEGQIVRAALLEQVRNTAQFVLDNARSKGLDAGKERWVKEDDLADNARELFILASKLAELGRSIDDVICVRTGELTDYDDDLNEIPVIAVPVAELRKLRDMLPPDHPKRPLVDQWVAKGEDQ